MGIGRCFSKRFGSGRTTMRPCAVRLKYLFVTPTRSATGCVESRNVPADPSRGQGMSPNCVWHSKYTAVSCSRNPLTLHHRGRWVCLEFVIPGRVFSIAIVGRHDGHAVGVRDTEKRNGARLPRLGAGGGEDDRRQAGRDRGEAALAAGELADQLVQAGAVSVGSALGPPSWRRWRASLDETHLHR